MEPLVLHASHASAGAHFSEQAGREVVARYQPPEAEEAAGAAGAALLDLSFRDVLRVTGEDRLSFLQGMLTQDVLALPDDAHAYAALCTAKGGLVSDCEVLRRREEVLLDLEPGAAARVKAALERFLVADDAEIHDARAAWAALELWGPEAPAVLENALGVRPPAGAALVSAGEGLCAGASWGARAGARLWMPRSSLTSAWEALVGAGARPCGNDIREVWRVEAGRPRYGADMDEHTLPLEANLGEAISYTKGCYLGQEVVARATYRGHVNWKLAGIALGDAELPPGTELSRGGALVGKVSSVVRSVRRGDFIALARVRAEATEPGTALTAQGREVRVSALPFP